jgi:hypothetical protein
MSQDSRDDEMRANVDFRRGVRGALLARYQRWAGITRATGPIPLNTSTAGETPLGQIVLVPSQYYEWSVVIQAPRTMQLEVSEPAQR